MSLPEVLLGIIGALGWILGWMSSSISRGFIILVSYLGKGVSDAPPQASRPLQRARRIDAMLMAHALNEAMESSMMPVKNMLEDGCHSSEDGAENLAQRVKRH